MKTVLLMVAAFLCALLIGALIVALSLDKVPGVVGGLGIVAAGLAGWRAARLAEQIEAELPGWEQL